LRPGLTEPEFGALALEITNPAPGESALTRGGAPRCPRSRRGGNPRRAAGNVQRFTLVLSPEAADRVFPHSGTTANARRASDARHESLQGSVAGRLRQLKLPKAHPIILAPPPGGRAGLLALADAAHAGQGGLANGRATVALQGEWQAGRGVDGRLHNAS